MTRSLGKEAIQRWVRFTVGGAINTGFTYAIYLALNLMLSYQQSYFIAYVIGIAFSYWFNSFFVFKAALSWRGLLTYPLVYVAQYLMSAVLLGVLVETAVAGEKVAPLLVLIFTVPLTYIVGKYVIQRSQ